MMQRHVLWPCMALWSKEGACAEELISSLLHLAFPWRSGLQLFNFPWIYLYCFITMIIAKFQSKAAKTRSIYNLQKWNKDIKEESAQRISWTELSDACHPSAFWSNFIEVLMKFHKAVDIMVWYDIVVWFPPPPNILQMYAWESVHLKNFSFNAIFLIKSCKCCNIEKEYSKSIVYFLISDHDYWCVKVVISDS